MLDISFTVDQDSVNIRIDKFLSEQCSKSEDSNIKAITRSKIQNLFDKKLIFNENNEILSSLANKTKINQIFTIKINNSEIQEASKFIAKKIDFEIIFEDDDLMVINKPAGLTVHPGSGNYEDTLLNGLLFSHKDQLSTINGEFRAGIVHRLDKDTNGLMLIAKNDFTHLALSNDLQERRVNRHYLAFIYGSLQPQSGRIDANIARCRNNRLKMSVSRNSGKNAITNYQTKEVFANNFASLVECKLETGRTHQIRVHLEYCKHSIIGDELYNSCKKNIPLIYQDEENYQNLKDFLNNFHRQALQAYKISFHHPRNKKLLSFEIDLAKDLEILYRLLKNLS